MFGNDLNGNRYKLRQRMFAIGDDFWIENDHGDEVYKVDEKHLRLRKTLVFTDPDGNEVCQIQHKLMHVTDTMAVEDPDGKQLAEVQRAVISIGGDRWKVKVHGRDEVEVHGSITDHEYTIGEDNHLLAKVSKSWFSISDTYGVEVAQGQNDAAILAVAVIIDEMAHDNGE